MVAATAFGVSSPICVVHLYLRWLDPLPASLIGTVEPVCCSVFLVFPVPSPLELVIEKTLYVSQGNVVSGAAFGRHMRCILHREDKQPFDTRVAHAMSTSEFRNSGGGELF